MERVPYYTVPADVARAIGSLSMTYRTKDGLFILSEKSMQIVINKNGGKTPEELGATAITDSDARQLIKQGGYQMGEVINNK